MIEVTGRQAGGLPRLHGGATARQATGSAGEPDDLGLVLAVRRGDEAAFATIVERYERRLRGMCFKYLRDVDLVDDVVQETFCRLFLTLDRVTEAGNLSPWIHRIATNLCLDELRRRARRPRADPSDEVLPGVVDSDLAGRPESVADAHATRVLIWEAMRRIPQRQRQILLLRDVYGMGHQEISLRLELPPGAVQGVLHRARERFKLEYVRLAETRTGDDECVKVAFVVDNINRRGLRRDRLHAVERHLWACPSCRTGLGQIWQRSDPAAAPAEVPGAAEECAPTLPRMPAVTAATA